MGTLLLMSEYRKAKMELAKEKAIEKDSIGFKNGALVLLVSILLSYGIGTIVFCLVNLHKLD